MKVEIDPKPMVSAAGKARVVRGVIHGLLQGRWQGADRLTELEATELFAISRTPVREALLELASMGIVELRRNCGAVFLPFGAKELRELYAVRSLLEVEATRLATTRIDGQVVDELREAFENLRACQRPDKGWKLDQALHQAIAEAAGNARLAYEITRYSGLVQTVREAVGKTLTDIHNTSVAEHLRILRHLKQRRADLAGEAMHQHLTQAADSAIRALKSLKGSK